MGTPAFAVASLDALLNAGMDVAAVVTAADKPAGRGLKLTASPVKQRAQELGIDVLQPTDLRDATFLEALDRTGASLYVVVAFRKLPREVYSRPALGCINLHASLLPDYRGAAPINWAVINGEVRTGATTFFIQEKIDTGDMIHQDAIAIGPDDTAGDVHDRLMTTGAQLLVKTARAILDGNAPRQAQPPGTGKGAPKLTPLNTRIDPRLPAQRVHDHIRGLSPYPGAWSVLSSSGTVQRVKVTRARITNDPCTGAPGSIAVQGERLLLRCADTALELLELQPEGRRRMSAAEFARGLRPGTDLHLQ